MRFNRVLLLAASINIAVLAMIFTLSCSGDKGGKGDPGTKCTVEGDKFVCDDGTSVTIGGSGPGPGGSDCHVEGQKYICDGEVVFDFSGSGCDIENLMGMDEVVQVDCGNGRTFRLCGGLALSDDQFCDWRDGLDGQDYGVPSALLDCGQEKYNPNDGYICKGSSVVRCSYQEHFWPDRSSDYTECSLHPYYRDCKNNLNESVGSFYVGTATNVSDKTTTYPTPSIAVEYQGTEFCKGNLTASAAVTTCAAEHGAGYTPNPTEIAAGNAPSKCVLKTNWRGCLKRSGNSMDTVGVFDATSSICNNYGETSASIETCASLNNNFSEYTPAPQNISSTSAPSYASNCPIYDECILDKNLYGECRDNNGVLKGIYTRKNQICKNKGDSDAQVQNCGAGMVPNNNSDEDVDHTQCIGGKVDCEGRTTSYWDPVKQYCYYNKAYSCLEGNKNEDGLIPEKTCRWEGSKWQTSSDGLAWVDGSCEGESSANALFWNVNTVANGGTASDKYYLNGSTLNTGKCFDSAKDYCESDEGLYNIWTGNTSNEEVDDNCTEIESLDRAACLSRSFYWGNLATVTTAGYCRRSTNLAKTSACDRVGIEFGAIANGAEPINSVDKDSLLGWDATANQCKKLNEEDGAFNTPAKCANNGYHWDVGVKKCFHSIIEAAKVCEGTSGSKWSQANNSCQATTSSSSCTPGASLTAGANDAAVCGATGASCISLANGFWNTTTAGSEFCQTAIACPLNQGLPTHNGNTADNDPSECIPCTAGKESAASVSFCSDCTDEEVCGSCTAGAGTGDNTELNHWDANNNKCVNSDGCDSGEDNDGDWGSSCS